MFFHENGIGLGLICLYNRQFEDKMGRRGLRPLVLNRPLAAAIGGSVSLGSGNIHANLQTLSLQLGDLLKVEGDPQAPLDVALSPTGTLAAGLVLADPAAARLPT